MSRCGFSSSHVYIYIYIYFFVFYIYIHMCLLSSHYHCGPLFDYLLVSTSGVRSGAYIFGSSVTPLPGLSSPDSPVVRRSVSLRLLLYLVVAHTAAFFSSSSSLRGSPPLSRQKRTIQPSLEIFHGLSASASQLADTVYVPPSPLLLRRKARKSHAGTFAPPTPLRVTGICKSIYL